MALREAILVYHGLLVSHREHLNRLNVYPVPDADTGTNLALTLQGVADSLGGARSMPEVCRAIRRGALLAARGASGVIMAQLLGAFASHLADVPSVSAPKFASALESASAAADQAVIRPVEGTILTVARDAATAAAGQTGIVASLGEVLAAARSAAEESLRRTPEVLPALREAGVVDSGGAAFVLLLDSLLHVVVEQPLPSPPAPAPVAGRSAAGQSGPRYEVVARLAVEAGALDEFRRIWDRLGNESTVVVEGEGWWLAHIHTDDPAAAMEAARAAGAVHDVQVTDLWAQVAEVESRQTE